DAVRTRLHEAARRAVDAVGYVGAGTVEFLVDTGDEHGRSLVDSGDGSGAEVYFLEMNTRLQVEHPVTECVTGTDLVALQIAVAEGHPLRGEAPVPWGHAVEVRVYAEDPADGWAPQTGVLRAFDVPGAESTFRVPGGYGLRVDSAVEPGTEVGVHYDAMLAKLVAWAPDRPAAIRMLRGAVRRARVHGVRTNLDLLSAVLADEEFVAGRVHTTLLDERLERWTAPRLSEDVVRRYAVAAALSDAAAAQSSRTVQRRIPPAFRNVSSAPRTRSYRLAGRETEVAYRDVRGRLAVEGGAVADGTVTVLEATPQRVRLECRGVVEAYAVSRTGPYADVDGPSGAATLEAVPRFVDPAAQVAHGSLLAPMPAAVVAVAVERGQRVARGQPVVVLEAMKMQHTISAPADGTVAELSVGAGDQVSSGAVLAVIEGDPDE
ncbi:MAG: biotin/lipoyl-containing protein, partial [Nocardioidaceae bacterium]